MNRQARFSKILTGAMFLCFALAALAAAVYYGLHLHYRLFSDALEAPYFYWREYYSSVLIKRLSKVWLASCALSVLAMVLLVIYGVCRHRKTLASTRRTVVASILCGCTLPISLWLFLDLLLRAICLIA